MQMTMEETLVIMAKLATSCSSLKSNPMLEVITQDNLCFITRPVKSMLI